MSAYIDPRPFSTYGFTAIKTDPAVSCDPGPYSNTTEVIFHNLSTDPTATVLIRVVDRLPNVVYSNLVVVGAFTTANSLVLLPGERLRVVLGPEGNRLSLANTLQAPQDPNDSYANLTFPRSILAMVLISTAIAASAVVNVTYVQSRGYTGTGTQNS